MCRGLIVTECMTLNTNVVVMTECYAFKSFDSQTRTHMMRDILIVSYKPNSDMKKIDLSSIVSSMYQSDTQRTIRQYRRPTSITDQNIQDESAMGRTAETAVAADNSYRLVDIPIVFHVLDNQDAGDVGSPNMTDAQRDYTIRQTNQLYNIYDRNTKTSTQFVTFVHNETIRHNDTITADCRTIKESEMISAIVKKSNEWQYKFHVVVCESKLTSGSAFLAGDHKNDDFRQNLVSSINSFDWVVSVLL
jgi:hypothetical protein